MLSLILLSESATSEVFAFALAMSNLVSTIKMRSDLTLVPDWWFSRVLSILEITGFPFSSSSSLFKMRTEDGEGEACGGGRGVPATMTHGGES